MVDRNTLPTAANEEGKLTEDVRIETTYSTKPMAPKDIRGDVSGPEAGNEAPQRSAERALKQEASALADEDDGNGQNTQDDPKSHVESKGNVVENIVNYRDDGHQALYWFRWYGHSAQVDAREPAENSPPQFVAVYEKQRRR